MDCGKQLRKFLLFLKNISFFFPLKIQAKVVSEEPGNKFHDE